MNTIHTGKSLWIFIALFLCLAGCAKEYDSACEELASKNSWEVSKRVAAAKRGSFERHFILLETGTELGSSCRSHYIDKETFETLPDSLADKCKEQSKPSDKYCTMYFLDGNVAKVRVY